MLPKPNKKSSEISTPKPFFELRNPIDDKSDPFYPEFTVLSKAVDAVNSFHSLYTKLRIGKSGPSTHEEQDLYRAMHIFACAGLDIFVKQLVKKKVPQILQHDSGAKRKFVDYVKKGLNRDDKSILNTLALALVSQSPRDILVSEYIDSLSKESLQSVDELYRVVTASGLDADKILSKRRNHLRDAFGVRHQIVHEMDINIDDLENLQRTTGHRTRRQRVATDMERHTRNILELACDLLDEYSNLYNQLAFGVKKATTT